MWMDEPFGMFSVMNTLFPILFFGIFALIIVMFVVTLARGAVRCGATTRRRFDGGGRGGGQAHAGEPAAPGRTMT